MTGRPKRRAGAFVPPTLAPFVEREGELSALRDLLKSAKAGRGNLILISGEAGIGKTRLADHFAAGIKSRSVGVLWGRCHADADVPAYWPWKQVFARHAERRNDSALRRELGAAARDIVPLVPQLAIRFPELARPESHEPPEARQRVLEGIIAFLRNAARQHTLVIVFDDLQWIDDISLSLLELSATECRESQLLLIAACRANDFRNAQVETRVANLSRNAHHLALTGLDELGVGKLVRAISGKAAPPSLARALHETTQGNPLFVDQLARFIAAHDAWHNADIRALGLPRELRLAIQSRLTRFSDESRLILRYAAVVGKTSSIDVLARVAGLSIEELLETLREPVAARVFHEVPGLPREYTFAHGLIRDALYDDVSPVDRSRLHRLVAEAILEVQGPNLNDQLSAVAHHFFQAAHDGDSSGAVEYCKRAGDRALASLAYEEAVGHYRRGLVASDSYDGDKQRRGGLLLQLGIAQRYAGNIANAKETFLEAIAIARETSDSELMARAALGFAGPWNTPLNPPDEQILELLREATIRLASSQPATASAGDCQTRP